MATINIRQLDDNVVRRLQHRASLNNRYLKSEGRHILECTAEDDMAVRRASFLAVSDRLRRKTEGRAHTPAEVLIRENRDHGHRGL